jgi:hypothetical protein
MIQVERMVLTVPLGNELKTNILSRRGLLFQT